MASSLADLEGGAINMTGIRCARPAAAGAQLALRRNPLGAGVTLTHRCVSRSEAGRRELLDALDAVRRRCLCLLARLRACLVSRHD